jgi:hypothetical protein
MIEEKKVRVSSKRWSVAGFSVVSGVLGLCSLAAYFGALFLDTGILYFMVIMAPCAICLGILARMAARSGTNPKSIWLANLGIVLGVLSLLFFAAAYARLSMLAV